MESFFQATIRRYFDVELPPDHARRKRWPLLIALHGYQGNKNSMMRVAQQIAGGAMVVISLQGPNQFLRRFGKNPKNFRVGFGWGTMYKMEESVQLHHHDLETLIQTRRARVPGRPSPGIPAGVFASLFDSTTATCLHTRGRFAAPLESAAEFPSTGRRIRRTTRPPPTFCTSLPAWIHGTRGRKTWKFGGNWLSAQVRWISASTILLTNFPGLPFPTSGDGYRSTCKKRCQVRGVRCQGIAGQCNGARFACPLRSARGRVCGGDRTPDTWHLTPSFQNLC